MEKYRKGEDIHKKSLKWTHQNIRMDKSIGQNKKGVNYSTLIQTGFFWISKKEGVWFYAYFPFNTELNDLRKKLLV